MAEKTEIAIEEVPSHDGYTDLLRELNEYGVTTLNQLSTIIPPEFAVKVGHETTTIFGLVRDWMIISDPEKMMRDVRVEWGFDW